MCECLVAATNRQLALPPPVRIFFRACKAIGALKTRAEAGCTGQRAARHLGYPPARKCYHRKGVVRAKRYGRQPGIGFATGSRNVCERESGKLEVGEKGLGEQK